MGPVDSPSLCSDRRPPWEAPTCLLHRCGLRSYALLVAIAVAFLLALSVQAGTAAAQSQCDVPQGAPPPTVACAVTTAPTDVDGNEATLHATIYPNGNLVACGYQYTDTTTGTNYNTPGQSTYFPREPCNPKKTSLSYDGPVSMTGIDCPSATLCVAPGPTGRSSRARTP